MLFDCHFNCVTQCNAIECNFISQFRGVPVGESNCCDNLYAQHQLYWWIYRIYLLFMNSGIKSAIFWKCIEMHAALWRNRKACELMYIFRRLLNCRAFFYFHCLINCGWSATFCSFTSPRHRRICDEREKKPTDLIIIKHKSLSTKIRSFFFLFSRS